MNLELKSPFTPPFPSLPDEGPDTLELLGKIIQMEDENRKLRESSTRTIRIARHLQLQLRDAEGTLKALAQDDNLSNDQVTKSDLIGIAKVTLATLHEDRREMNQFLDRQTTEHGTLSLVNSPPRG